METKIDIDPALNLCKKKLDRYNLQKDDFNFEQVQQRRSNIKQAIDVLIMISI
jgi:hypothetical protein